MFQRLFLSLFALVLLASCAGGTIGDNNITVTCTGNCPDLVINGVASEKDGIVPQKPATPIVVAKASQPLISKSSIPKSSQECVLSSGTIRPGDGHAYVWAGKRQHRTVNEIATIIRNDDRSILRVSADEIMRQVACRLGRGNWESRSAFADWLESSEVGVQPCSKELLGSIYLSRVSGAKTPNAQVFDHKWSRTECDKGELLLTYQGRPFLSSTCLNLADEKNRPAAPVKKSAPVEVSSVDGVDTCPKAGYHDNGVKNPESEFLVSQGYRAIVICAFDDRDTLSAILSDKARDEICSQARCVNVRSDLYKKGKTLDNTRDIIVPLHNLNHRGDKPIRVIVAGKDLELGRFSGSSLDIPAKAGRSVIWIPRESMAEGWYVGTIRSATPDLIVTHNPKYGTRPSGYNLRSCTYDKASSGSEMARRFLCEQDSWTRLMTKGHPVGLLEKKST
jgi:hypothetical protein